MATRPIPKDGMTARRTILRADKTTKVTLRLSVGTSALLSVMSNMSGSSRSAEAERLILAGGANITIMRNGKEYAAGTVPDEAQG